MGRRLTIVLAVASALLFSLGVAASEVAGRRQGYRAGVEDGASRKEAEMLRSFDDVRQVAIDSLRREHRCELGDDRFEDPPRDAPRGREPQPQPD